MWKFFVLLFLVFTSGCEVNAKPVTSTSSTIPQVVTVYPSSPPVTFRASTRIIPTWKNPIHLNYGEKVTLNDGAQITFADVLEDHRCAPIDANCSRAGNIKILLVIQLANDSELQMKLNYITHSSWFGGHVIELVKVMPEPSGTTPVEKMNYEIWIQVLLI